MRITVLRKTEYKNCPVYILQFGTVFQYLFIFENEIYQHHGFLPPNPFLYILYFLRLRKFPYSEGELKGGEEAILNGALSAIDLLKKQKCQTVSTNAEPPEGKSGQKE